MSIDRIIISGGGTGGHIFPALAIADEVKRRNADADILFVGAEGRMEMEKIPARGYTIVGLPISGIQRRLTLKNLWVPFRLLRSFIKAYGLVRRFKPQIVVGVGGYASGPTLMAASHLGYTTAIQEQNSYPGITNKWLGRRAAVVCVAYPNMEGFFAARKLRVLGNPVREDIVALNTRSHREEALKFWGLSDKPTLLVIGGSLGATRVNECFLEQHEALLQVGYQLIWQTGARFYDRHKETLEALAGEQLRVVPFIREMHWAYAAADLVVSRAGALSISELAVVGKPTVFVPSPYVSEDHQTRNADQLVSVGAARMVAEKDIREALLAEVTELLGNDRKREQIAAAIKEWARPDATRDIVDELEKAAYGG